MAVLALVVTLAGCAGSGTEPARASGGATTAETEGTRPAPAPAPDDVPELATPLAAYMLSWDEVATVNHARSVLIQRCMSDFGFDLPVRSYDEELSQVRAGEREGVGRTYGITDTRVAQEYGYGLPPATATDTSAQVEPTPTFLYVLWGTKDRSVPAVGETESPGSVGGRPVPGGGCTSEADRTLGLSPDISVYGMARDLWIEHFPDLTSSAGYRSAVSDWAGCLAEKGYHVTDPVSDQGDIKKAWDARAAAGEEGIDRPSARREVELALADIACKSTVDLVGRVNAVAVRLDQRVIDRNRPALEEDRRRLDKQVKRASALVAE